ncbi:GFA family protein [Siccirubricoccus sp. KC 17139]|uniref:GFA family protein n=1 Tax=Siccirubricoccus soli TaxID=2899147 RepID=A0ABT1D7E8_9PROT|nr:GFA family protein [Siccirubricoccus soli]MCO6417527.1 GFA family protein [Siccirubricoccus soli]MCP2683662.1 GFA family protein [Siccirubricoccus soli]
MLTGGCLCGEIRYEAHGTPFHPTLCHCRMCRLAAGAPVVAWFSVKREDYRLVAGTPARYASSPGVVRTFCPRCGTSLTFESAAHAAEIDITTASLDDPDAVPPQDHTRAAYRIGWVSLADGLTVYPERRPSRSQGDG